MWMLMQNTMSLSIDISLCGGSILYLTTVPTDGKKPLPLSTCLRMVLEWYNSMNRRLNKQRVIYGVFIKRKAMLWIMERRIGRKCRKNQINIDTVLCKVPIHWTVSLHKYKIYTFNEFKSFKYKIVIHAYQNCTFCYIKIAAK